MQDLLTRTGPQLPPLADSLLEVAFQETGVRLGRERVLAGCRTALAAIHEGKLPTTACRLRLPDPIPQHPQHSGHLRFTQ